MNTIDWQCIADAIREGRFEDITREVWNLVADKIEPKKRGRPSKPKLESFSWNDSEPPTLNNFNKWFQWKQKQKNITAMDCYCKIKELYNSLIAQGIPSGEATNLVADAINKDLKINLNYKSIESVLTAIREHDKINRELEQEES